ncbi:MFS transporter [Pelagibacterium lentulum]|uniref:MFS transporter n=1 Tax=Pelagibacterium lentulum TaxID=2029865 RepID=A0A916W3E5_9HYPH|nr:MFS transporter [Pelagibacterium lentulum]GGA62708.1 MFS transporter [Pelagibacterium lentulum]
MIDQPINPDAKATAREWIGLALLIVPCLLVAMDLSVLLFAVPALSQALNPSGTQLLWIIDIYGFTLAGLLITMGTLGDRIGRRKLLIIGAGLFALASLAAAFSASAEQLILTRALLGMAGATLAPSTLALIRNMFSNPSQRQLAIGIWTGGFAGGATLGPIVGGLLLEHFWWGAVFLINVPAMILLVALAPLVLPEYRDPLPGRFDLFSAVLSLAAVLTVIYGVKEIAAEGVSILSGASLVAGLLLGIVFISRQFRLADPLIDLGLFAVPAFTAAMASNALAGFALLGISLFNIQYMLLVLDMSPFIAALWSLPTAVAVIVAATAGALLTRVMRPGLVMSLGLGMVAAGLGMLGQLSMATSFWFFLAGMTVMSSGMGLVASVANDMIVSVAPAARAGSAAAIAETSNELSGALGIALLGSLGSLVFRNGLPPVLEAQSLASALDLAARLPVEAGSALRFAANQAFVSSLALTAGTAAAVLAVAAIIALLLLREVVVEAQPSVERHRGGT